jgi:hypothetical protein
MKSKNKSIILAAGLLAAFSASATINIDTVLVGDAGNANDSTGYGGVGYDYYIGTHEVTNSQYTAFLNAKATTDTYSLYNTSMNSSPFGGITRAGSSGSYTYSVKSGFENKPVNFVTFWDAARFSNWLTNGGGSGDTETGMYNLNGITNPTNNTVARQLDFSLGQNGVAIASENEWYKAAYYDGSGGYTEYPTQSNSINTGDANYDDSVGTVTDVGTYAGDGSHYGTFDQGGNVWEWNDAIVSTNSRGQRGGAFDSNRDFLLGSSFRFNNDPTNNNNRIGFRVSSLAPIPEPSAYAAIFGCLGLMLALMRRKGRGTL